MSEQTEKYNVRPSSVISMPVEDRDKLKADTRREALEWACAEMCQWCGIGIEVKQLEEEVMIHNRLYGPKGSWVHLDGETGKYLECHADAIRKLIERG